MSCYYHNLEYKRTTEEEYKQKNWNECIKLAYKDESKLFMSLNDLTVNLAYTIEDEAMLEPIFKDLKSRK